MRYPREFKEQAEKLKINRWMIHECTICDYPCGFHFYQSGVKYDNGCHCRMAGLRDSSWKEVADHYNLQGDEKVIQEMNEFWGFTK